MAQHTEVHCKRQGTTQKETVVIQCNRTEGRRRSPTSAPARVHTPADNPNRSGGQRTGQRGDQVCSQALAATSGEVKVRDDLGYHSTGLGWLVSLRTPYACWECPYSLRVKVKFTGSPDQQRKDGSL